LGELISAPPATPAVSVPTPHPPTERSAIPKKRKPAPPAFSRRSRLGRPAGKTGGKTSAKEKFTVRIDAGLIAAYRDWSWEARCQVGELVEKALRHFLLRRNN
jgi:uncharacterized protein (DUF4415 family)